LHGQRQTGIDALTIDQDRTGAASALVAPLLGAWQMKMIAQEIEQRGAIVEVKLVGLTVDAEPHALAPAARSPEPLNAGLALRFRPCTASGGGCRLLVAFARKRHERLRRPIVLIIGERSQFLD
jgi:hypothetical protein